MDKVAYNISEAAKMMGLCKNTVIRLIKDGKLPAKRPCPRRIIVPLSAINEYLKGNDFDRA